ncbi:MAG: sialate O-acetylesterase [Phycisphaerales bacterium]
MYYCGVHMFMGFVASSASPERPTDVFLLIGQSNMAGRAPMVDADHVPIQRVLLLNDAGTWESARQPLNRHASDHKGLNLQGFNLGGPFAAALRTADHTLIPGLIVNARGKTRIEQWLPGEVLYENALKRVRALKGIELAGVLWHQGESNHDDADYAGKLERVVVGLRKDLGQPDLPFIAGHISIDNRINDQIDALTEKLPYMTVVAVNRLATFDGVHYDRDSMITLGQRYAEAYIKLAVAADD